MTATKMKMTAAGAALAGLLMVCGCGRSSSPKQNMQSAQTANVPTEWNQYDKNLSPFTKVRLDNGKALVTYNGVEYELAAVNGISVPDMLKFCHDHYQDRWQKRFVEDLQPVLHDMGHPVSADNTVSLTLVDPATGTSTEVANAAITQENRSSVLRAEQESKNSSAGATVTQ
jgi:hypothetical protein